MEPEEGYACKNNHRIFQCLKENADICTVTLGDFGDKEFALRPH